MDSPVKIQKSLLRKKFENIVHGLGARKRKKKSGQILRRLLRRRDFKKSKSVLIYVSLRNEVETRPVIQKALAAGKKVFIPRIQAKKINIYRILSLKKDLRKGAYGIWEPKPSGARRGRPSRLDLVLVPGLGFDREGRRLGRGLGYFDRFLAKVPHAKKIGLAFREQIVSKIPVEKHDVPVDGVLTD